MFRHLERENKIDEPVSHTDGVGRDYKLKCHLINRCFQEEIRFGHYQWQLFIITGLEWLADNLWLNSVLAAFAGLIVGATTWGIMADLIGRRLSFNITLFLTGLFGLVAGGVPNFVTFCSLAACMGFGVGGNWCFIANFSCDPSIPSGQCPKSANMGWGYTLYTVGAPTFPTLICGFFVFDVQESSKFLVVQGRDEESIKVLEHIARRDVSGDTTSKSAPNLSTSVCNAFSGMSLSHVRPHFSSRRLAINTTLTIIIWGLIGIAYPLFNAFLPLYLSAQGAASGSSSVSETYRNFTIISILGIPGSLIACTVVDYTRGTGWWLIGGRKLALAMSTVMTGLFLFLFATSRTTSAMYGVLYAYTPEAFPAPRRGTGDALCPALNRIGGFIAPLIKISTTPISGSTSAATVDGYIVIASMIVVLMMAFVSCSPIFTAGKTAL
ncbi:major facilitator superfamily domain-containing protein [Suillus americanus]|nr:major facilitator superfamily domain-containing protein [Suillus americanus]